MKKSEIETMRKAFNTVKSRSSKINNSSRIEYLKDRVKSIKEFSIDNFDSLYREAFDSFKRNGIDVEFAETGTDAINIILKLLEDYDVKVIAKSKSNTLGEINLKDELSSENWIVVETDLGDRLLQLKKVDNKPVHPTGPASH